MKYNKGIKNRLLIYIISSTFIVIGLIIFHNLYISSKFLLKNVKQNAQNITISSVNKIESILQSIEKINQTQALYLETFNYSENDIKTLLYNIVKNNKEVYGSCIAFEPYSFTKTEKHKSFYYHKSASGIKFKNLGVENYNYFIWDWYQITKIKNEPYWTEPYFDKNAGSVIMSTYSVPFYKTGNDGKRKLHGIVTIDVSLDWLRSIVDSIKFYKTGYAFLLSQTGTFITHPNTDFIMNQTIFSLAEEYNKPFLASIGTEMIEGKNGFEKIIPVSINKESWMYFEPLPSVKWSMGVIVPEDELYADLYGLFISLILISLTGLLLLILIIVTVARNITNPLIQLAKATIAIGNGNFNVQLPEIKTEDEISQLNRSIKVMQKDLKMYLDKFEEQTINKEKMLNELKIAHDIQVSFIPRNYPAFPEIKSIDIHGQVESAKEVGGDLFDYFMIDKNKLCITICDVSSFGMPASLFMAFARTIIRAKAQKNLILSEIVSEINKDLCIDNEKIFSLTFFIGILDINCGKFEYCNADHLPPIWISTTKNEKYLNNQGNETLGLNYDSKFKTTNIKLNQNDLIVFYTDGVTEALNADADFYSSERLLNALRDVDLKNVSAKNLTETLIDDVKLFANENEQTDDITILTLMYKGLKDKKS